MPKDERLNSGVRRFQRDLERLAPLLNGTRLGLAVSGGPDSMALAWLTQQALTDVDLRVAVVDHGLRAQSQREAEAVRARLSALGLQAEILTWSPPSPVTSRKMEQARLARYALLQQWARSRGILRIWLGHHADDQRETIAMRLRQSQQNEGLRGMDPVRVDADVVFERPVLGWSKAELVALCDLQGLVYVTDPTNEDPQTQRGRLRRDGLDEPAARPPAGIGLIPAPQTGGLVAHPLGHVWARSKGLSAAALRACCGWVRGGHYAPTEGRAEAALTVLERAGRASLFGCVVERRSEGWTLIAREARRNRRLDPALMEDGRWRLDDRWVVDRPDGAWSLLERKPAGSLDTLVDRAAASCLTWNDAVPECVGNALVWAGNRALFSPRRPLVTPVSVPRT